MSIDIVGGDATDSEIQKPQISLCHKKAKQLKRKPSKGRAKHGTIPGALGFSIGGL